MEYTKIPVLRVHEADKMVYILYLKTFGDRIPFEKQTVCTLRKFLLVKHMLTVIR